MEESDDPAFGGDVGFVLDDPQSLAEPIPCRGALGFWTVPDDIAQQIEGSIRWMTRSGS
ncbi:MAG: hypothetical protein OXH75_16395 [Acidobacteria bacterium]|nr:hypothetical protein [Acidobacteriota bacterium]